MILSIIIITRNEASRISSCLETIIEQVNSYIGLIEVIVVDGNSEDGTQEIVEKYVKKYAYIHLLKCHKYGYSYQRNRGAMFANGERILYISGDTKIAYNCIKRLLSLIQDYDIIQGTIINNIVSTKASKYIAQAHRLVYKTYLNSSIERFSTILVCIPKKFILECMFTEGIASLEDKEWMIRVTRKFPHMRFYHAKGLILFHDIHETIFEYCKKIYKEAVTVGFLYEQYNACANIFNWYGVTKNFFVLIFLLALTVLNVLLGGSMYITIAICFVLWLAVLIYVIVQKARRRTKILSIFVMFMFCVCISCGFTKGYMNGEKKSRSIEKIKTID